MIDASLCSPTGESSDQRSRGTLANSVTKPAGTTMLSRVLPIWYDIGRWSTAASGPFLRKYRSGESTAFGGGGGASGRTTISVALGVVARRTVSVFATVSVSLCTGATAAGRARAAVSGRLGAAATVGADAGVSVRAPAVDVAPLSTAMSTAAM